jgi:RNA polymerase sigma factor FliA
MNAAIKSALSKNEVKKDTARRDQLILEHLPLVTAVAAHVRRSLPVHTELDDLVHAGVMGLFDAATKYQGNRKIAFPTYAKYRIRGAILDSLRQLDWASRDLRKRHRQMETVTRDLTAKLQRTPTQVELAAAMGLSGRRWQNLMVDFRNLGFVAARLRTNDREDQPMNDPPCAPGHSPEEVFARSETRAKLNSVRETLPERYQQVVTLYYDRDQSMKEIGAILGVNESRVSQIHKGALQRMQSALSGTGIRSAAAF